MRPKIHIRGVMPPAMFTDFEGQRWVVSGSTWIKVSSDAKYEDIEFESELKKHEKPDLYEGIDLPFGEHTFVVESSKGDGQFYEVKVTKGMWPTCTCHGYMYRRKCKHVDMIFEKLKKEHPKK